MPGAAPTSCAACSCSRSSPTTSWPGCAAEGRVIVTGPGPVYAEGDPAERCTCCCPARSCCRAGSAPTTSRPPGQSDPGVYAGAFYAYLGDRVPQVYNNSMRVTEPSRFFVLDAAKFAQLMTDWFPMAVHLLEGLFFGTKNTMEAIGQRERLLALGALSAGPDARAEQSGGGRGAGDGGAARARSITTAAQASGDRRRQARRRGAGAAGHAPRRRGRAGRQPRPRWARWRPPTWRTRSPTGWTSTASAQSWELAPAFVRPASARTSWIRSPRPWRTLPGTAERRGRRCLT